MEEIHIASTRTMVCTCIPSIQCNKQINIVLRTKICPGYRNSVYNALLSAVALSKI